MGTERRTGKFTREGNWGATTHHAHQLEVHRASDIVTYLIDGETSATFTVEQFEDLMAMAASVDYLKQPDRD